MNWKIVLFSLCIMTHNLVFSQVESSITYDPQTGNYIIEYQGYIDTVSTIIRRTFEPSTKIDPSVKVNVVSKDLDYQYNYKVYNGITSTQRLQDFDLDVLTNIHSVEQPDQYWKFDNYSYIPIAGWFNSKDPSGLNHPLNGIAPGSSEDGFSFVSNGLPAIIKAYFRGKPKIYLTFPDEPPSEIEDSLSKLEKFSNNTVSRFTIGPKNPMAAFMGDDFLDTLINYNNRSFDLNWIKNQIIKDLPVP